MAKYRKSIVHATPLIFRTAFRLQNVFMTKINGNFRKFLAVKWIRGASRCKKSEKVGSLEWTCFPLLIRFFSELLRINERICAERNYVHRVYAQHSSFWHECVQISREAGQQIETNTISFLSGLKKCGRRAVRNLFCLFIPVEAQRSRIVDCH